MSLQDWLNNGWLRKHKTSNQEITNLLEIVKRDIKDAEFREVSPDWRFGIAYNAALKICTILLYAEGFKPERNLAHYRTFRDPYVLDFLGLSDTYSEKHLESAILAELQRFIIELGNDFAFLARQKRITIDNRDYYIDLLFYHRRLHCLIAIDLKVGEFEAAHKGQMELYLRYLEKYEQIQGEATPIGLILCAGKNQEHVELLQLQKSNIRVADYLTLLPSRETLQAKLHESIALARSKLGEQMPTLESNTSSVTPRKPKKTMNE